MDYLGVATDEPTFTSITMKAAPSVKLTGMGKISQSLTPVAVATVATVEQTFSVPGLAVGDYVSISPPSITAGVAPVCARVSAANTLAVTFVNSTAGSLTPPAGVYQIQFTR